MNPIYGEYPPFCCDFDPISFSRHVFGFDPYHQFMCQTNFNQQINSFNFNISKNMNKPYHLLSTEELETQFKYYVEKKHQQMFISPCIKTENFQKEEKYQSSITRFQNEEQSSYQNKRKRAIIEIKKTKQGPQNRNRNIVPSIVQQMLTYVTKQIKSKSFCQEVFKSIQIPDDSQITISRYYSYLRQVRQKQNHFVNISTLKILLLAQDIGINLYSKVQQEFYLKVARIIAQHFLLEVSPFLTIHSKRISNDKKHDHLAVCRDIYKAILDLSV